MTADLTASVKASRVRVPRTRGALSGVLLLLLGAWAALVPFIGPYFNFAFTPAPGDSWHWTAARGYLEVLPGAAAFVGGLLLLLSTSRLTTSLGGWLGVAGGAWLTVSPPLADLIGLNLGTPDPASSKGVRALEELLFFFAIGAAILFVASVAIGRLSVHSVRDVRAAERRAEAEQAAAAAEERRAADQRRAAEERRAADDRAVDERRAAEDRQTTDQPQGQGQGQGQGQMPTNGPGYAPNYPPPGAQAGGQPAQYPPPAERPPAR